MKTQPFKLFINFIILILLIVNFTFCDNASKKENKVSYFMGRKLYLPKSSKILYRDSIYINKEPINNKAKFKITTMIWGECNSCIRQLRKWNEFFHFIQSKEEIEIMFYLLTSDIKYFREGHYIKSIHNYPLIIDKEFKYADKNNISLKNQQYQTFLLDSNNKVILVGNPVFSKSLMELYKREINKRLD